ncbi:hypothetical protein ROZALSC1DRAFT_25503, partial [Rozella allomycis CSF55]
MVLISSESAIQILSDRIQSLYTENDTKLVAAEISHMVQVDIIEEKDISILEFIRKSVAQNDDAATRGVLLEVLQYVLVEHEKFVGSEYDILLKDLSVYLFTVDKDSKVKKAALDLVQTLLVMRREDGSVEERLGVNALFERFVLEYVRQQTNLRPAVKGAILCLLGTIVGIHFQHIKDEKKIVQFVKMAMQVVYFEVFETKKKTELMLLAGALKGMNEFLKVKESSRFIESVNDLVKKLYLCVKATMKPPENLKRYDVCRESLSLFMNIVNLFEEFLVKDYRNCYGLLLETSQHNNKDIE